MISLFFKQCAKKFYFYRKEEREEKIANPRKRDI